MNSRVTANASPDNYGLLMNVNNRPIPRALQPHVNPSGGGSRYGGSRQSGSNSVMQHRAGSRDGNRSGLMAAGQSSLSTGKLPGTKAVSKQGGFFPPMNVAASQNLGRLPTLGLNQIKLEEFHDEDNNMFRIHKKTEHLLVARELEREFKDLNKFEKDNLNIWQKGISTRIDRPGTIRVINDIPALKPELDKKKQLAAAQSQDDM